MMLTLSLAAGLLLALEPQSALQKGWIFELQFPEKPQIEPVETRYHDDLAAFFKQVEMQIRVDAVEAVYVDDLPLFFKSLKQQIL